MPSCYDLVRAITVEGSFVTPGIDGGQYRETMGSSSLLARRIPGVVDWLNDFDRI